MYQDICPLLMLLICNMCKLYYFPFVKEVHCSTRVHTLATARFRLCFARYARSTSARFVHTQTHRHTDTQTHRQTDTQRQTHRHTDTHTHTHTQTDTQKQTHRNRHTETDTHVHVLITLAGTYPLKFLSFIGY